MVVSFRNSCCMAAPKKNTENLWIHKGILALTSCTSNILISRTKNYPPFIIMERGIAHHAQYYIDMTSNAHLFSHSYKSIVIILILVCKIIIEKQKICSAMSSVNKVHVEYKLRSSTHPPHSTRHASRNSETCKVLRDRIQRFQSISMTHPDKVTKRLHQMLARL